MGIEDALKRVILSSLGKLGLGEVDFSLEPAGGLKGENRGDYATNVALTVYPRENLGAKSPFELGQKIADSLKKEADLAKVVSRIEVVPPGFINFYLSDNFYFSLLKEAVEKGDNFGRGKIGQGKTVIIDYSSPNIAKPFGVGHLRSTIIGQALYNIYAFLGYRVIGDNHLGDWGTQFGVLLFQIDRKGLDVDKLTIKNLEELYVEFHQGLKKNPGWQEEARSYFKRLEKGEQKLGQIWEKIVRLSLAEYERIYQLLGVKIDLSLGESFYKDKMAAVLADARRKNLVVESEGALIIPLEKSLVPAMLVKSDGATTYLLRDLATIKYRVRKYHPELIIYEVGADHKLHFGQVFEVAQKLGYLSREKLVHVAHGMIRGKFGELSTRAGKSIHLEEVLLEAIERAKRLAAQALSAKDLSLKEQEEVAKTVGIGAMKYNDLKQNPRTNIVFNWEKVLSLEGNSGPYLQYTYARARRVIEKGGGKIDLPKVLKYRPKSDELSIARLICYFEGTIEKSAQRFSPNLIADLLYRLAQSYNAFYSRRRVLVKNREARSFRLLLTAATAQTIKTGLGLLGIEAPEKM